MKPEKPKAGLVRRFASAFTENWWLKLLALALALTIYHTLKPSSGQVRDINERTLFKY